MKRFLSAGEGYASSRPLKPLCILLFLFYFTFSVEAKQPATGTATTIDSEVSPFKALKIGQKIPRNVLMGDPVYNAEAEQITTRDFRGRAVIIDIWATWCGSCTAVFPKMDSLQREYANHLDIYLMNNLYRDSEEKIESFLRRYKERYPAFSLPVIVGNLDTRALFPGTTLPHYVWIDANGRVKAITGREDVTGENIERLIAGLSVDVNEKLK